MPTQIEWIELRKELHDVLVNAFTADVLERMLVHECGVRLAEIIAGKDNLHTIVFKVVMAAEQGQWVETLAAGAKRANPYNVEVVQVVDRILAAATADRAAFYAEIEKSWVDLRRHESSPELRFDRSKALDRYLEYVINTNHYLQLQGIRSGGKLVHVELDQIYVRLRTTAQRVSREAWVDDHAELVPGDG